MQAELELATERERNEDLRRDYEALLENLKWVHAIASILVEQEGGVVEVTREELEGYDLRGTLQVKPELGRDLYVIQVVPFGVNGEVVE